MRKSMLIAVVTAALLCPQSGRAFGALLEHDLMREIFNSVSVMRYLHEEIRQLEETKEMVENTLDLTEKQYAAQQQLVEEERGRDDPLSPIRLEMYEVTLRRLEENAERLRVHNLIEAYAARIASIREQMVRYEVQLEAKVVEFRIHIGRDPGVEVDFEAEVSRFRRRRMDISYLTIR